jgi:hypothetical protein
LCNSVIVNIISLFMFHIAFHIFLLFIFVIVNIAFCYLCPLCNENYNDYYNILIRLMIIK